MKRLRTINQMIRDIKKDDPDSCVTKYMIVKIIKKFNIQSTAVGNKLLYDFDEVLGAIGLI